MTQIPDILDALDSARANCEPKRCADCLTYYEHELGSCPRCGCDVIVGAPRFGRRHSFEHWQDHADRLAFAYETNDEPPVPWVDVVDVETEAQPVLREMPVGALISGEYPAGWWPALYRDRCATAAIELAESLSRDELDDEVDEDWPDRFQERSALLRRIVEAHSVSAARQLDLGATRLQVLPTDGQCPSCGEIPERHGENGECP